MENDQTYGICTVPLELADGQIIHAEAVLLDDEEPVSTISGKLSELMPVLQSIADCLMKALSAVSPDKTTVEFGMQIALESGKLTSLLVSGTGKANIKIVLEWNGSSESVNP